MVFLNGEFVEEEKAQVSIFDRGFLYGDGLFETLRVVAGRPFRWKQHGERFEHGADFLNIRLPFDREAQRRVANELLERNGVKEGMLRITLSRGAGPRGYSVRGAESPTFAMTVQAAPRHDGREQSNLRLVQSSVRIPTQTPWSAFKTANRLPQILARTQADGAGVDEALVLNERGEVVEATAANLFWIEDDTLCTPSLESGALPGITRGIVLELARNLKIPAREASAQRERLLAAEGIFLTNSGAGIVDAAELDAVPLRSSPWIARLQAAYADLVESEGRSLSD